MFLIREKGEMVMKMTGQNKNLKTIKVKPSTYDLLIKIRAKIEYYESKRHSFDRVINKLVRISEATLPSSFETELIDNGEDRCV